MGNVSQVFADITEDGNSWELNAIKIPNIEEVLARNTEDQKWHPPRLLLASDVKKCESCRGTSEEFLQDLEPFQALPQRQMVLDASSPSSEERRDHDYVRKRKGRFLPLSSCSTLSDCLLLTQNRLKELSLNLPLACRIATTWKLLYCPKVHGVSIRTFFRQCQAFPGETLILIEDSNGAIFGCFASHTWQAVMGQQQHFGLPDCFVFQFSGPEEDPTLSVHNWAGGNEHFMYAGLQGISMGGGRSRALWVDQEFLYGTSEPCETFGNKKPLSAMQDFVIRNFECWGFDSSMIDMEINGPRETSECYLLENLRRTTLRQQGEMLQQAGKSNSTNDWRL
eukprot:TRINITY_DN36133_c5_g1_i1.p1 TRINITY_DN36133_c5_g1~~TRINITY_DN36133_c5_g1_i1.p1  ORF type:complete len:338 (+),score=45.40 TRINITY_DN36133_c5_g1_i1:101-1114(+)